MSVREFIALKSLVCCISLFIFVISPCWPVISSVDAAFPSNQPQVLPLQQWQPQQARWQPHINVQQQQPQSQSVNANSVSNNSNNSISRSQQPHSPPKVTAISSFAHSAQRSRDIDLSSPTTTTTTSSSHSAAGATQVVKSTIRSHQQIVGSAQQQTTNGRQVELTTQQPPDSTTQTTTTLNSLSSTDIAPSESPSGVPADSQSDPAGDQSPADDSVASDSTEPDDAVDGSAVSETDEPQEVPLATSGAPDLVRRADEPAHHSIQPDDGAAVESPQDQQTHHLRPSRHSVDINHQTTTTRQQQQPSVIMRQGTTRSPSAAAPALRTSGPGSTSGRNLAREGLHAVSSITTTTPLPLQAISAGQQRSQQQQQRQTLGSFGVNVGADRMLIKPASVSTGNADASAASDEHAAFFWSSPTPLAPESSTASVATAGRVSGAAPPLVPHGIFRPHGGPSTIARPSSFVSRSSPTAGGQHLQVATTPTTTTTPVSTTIDNSDLSSFGGLEGDADSAGVPTSHELTNESVTHHRHVSPPSGASDDSTHLPPSGGRTGGATTSSSAAAAAFNDRLMYPPSGRDSSYQHQHDQHHQHHVHNQQQGQQSLELASLGVANVASICYTPFSLFMVILVTILMTLIVAFCALQLIKYLKRHHQFDLVANSKHFNHKHLSSSSGYLRGSNGGGGGGGNGGAPTLAYHAGVSPGTTTNERPGGATNEHRGACMLHPFLHDDDKCTQTFVSSSSPFAAAATARAVSCEPAGGDTNAFRNPYFTSDELPPPTQQQQQRHRVPTLATTNSEPVEFSGGNNSSDLLRMALAPGSSSEQMHFIESHIANLHNRQVTSSVKELSSLGDSSHHLVTGGGNGGILALPLPPPQVVDLTSDEQRARVRANPREGDLVAVDLSGHDIIGLGLDVCGGGARDNGVFVRWVSAHGPASESGCIAPGDRIKCLNVSFESPMTLQDARDILNCAAPYKMRLLIEKRMASASELKRMQSGGGGVSSSHQLTSTCQIKDHHSGQVDQPKSALETTRAYLRQLTGKMLGGANKSDDHQICGGDSAPPNNARHQHESQLFVGAAAAVAPIGSLAARAQMQRLGSAASDRTAASFSNDNASTITAHDHEQQQQQDHHQHDRSASPPKFVVERVGGTTTNYGDARQRQQQSDREKKQQRGGAEQHVVPSSGQRARGHRRGESCHINGAFRADDDDLADSSNCTDRHDDDKQQRQQQQHDEPHDEHADKLFHYDCQNKLMMAGGASGQTFISKSRLTM